MSTTRQTVFEALADTTSTAGDRTATAADLAATLDADEAAVRSHLTALVDCHLAVHESGGGFRISVTGEELRALDLDDGAIVDPRPDF